MSNHAVTAGPSENLRTLSVKVPSVSNVCFMPNGRLQCCYTNDTRQFQIIRMTSVTGEFLEKAVPPYVRVFFEAGTQDHLEVHTGSVITSVLSDRIPCMQLACLVSWPTQS